ncbi:formate dehydrogenase subunit delta [Sphingobium sp. ZW T5_29]|uniref:formate dehydrogenase subunit delta n=1 Tax=Sphingobium sp. ZW T5_29 TaxID=3378077 RepID=UPI003853B2D0
MSDEPNIMSTSDRLVYMAEQIARNMVSMGEDRAARAVAEHLTSFWDPRMKEHILAIARDEPHRLSPTVAAAIAHLAQSGKAVQPDAAQFNSVDEVGHCDAG